MVEHTHKWVFISNVSCHRNGPSWDKKKGVYTYWCPSCGAIQQVYRKKEDRGLAGEDTVDTFQPVEKSA